MAQTLLMVLKRSFDTFSRGAHDRIRTDGLFLTKEVLHRLSYVGKRERKTCHVEPTGRQTV